MHIQLTYSVTFRDGTPNLPQHGLQKRLSSSSTSNMDPETEVPFAEHPTIQFLRDMNHRADTHSSGQTSQASLLGNRDMWPVETDPSAMVVPMRAIADGLLASYENVVYPLFPILHMPTFRESYERLWRSQGQGQFETLAAEAIFHATLNIVFALGSINNSQVEPHLKLQKAEIFYRRARHIMPSDALDVANLEVVQYLLLTTNYLSFTRYSNRCRNTLAVTIRVAQTLGLDLDVESSSGNQLKREISRRLWHLCLTFERSVTLTHNFVYGQQFRI